MNTPSTQDPAAMTPGVTPKQRKPRGPIDARTLTELQKDEEVVLAVQDEMTSDAAFATALGSYHLDGANTIAITPASITALAKQIAAARKTGGDATDGTSDFHDATDEERGDAEVLIASIRNVQARAKSKYEECNPAKLKSYFVGTKLKSRKEIEQVGNVVYNLVRTTDDDGHPITAEDTLPGLSAEAIAMFETNLNSYTGVQTKQGKAQKNASNSRVSFKEQCAQILRRRRKLQFAIEAEYPPSEETAALRKRCGLPGTRAMS